MRKQFRYPWCQKEGGGGEGAGWKQPPFHFLKEKLSGNKVCVKAALYSNKTSHRTYLREGRSTFAVSTVVNQLRKRYMVKSDTAISYIRSDSMGILQQDAPIGETHARAGRIVYGSPWDTSAEDVSMWTGWDSLETMYKLRLTEFVFKCLNGYTVTEFKDLFLQRNSGPRRNENIILPRPEKNFIRNSIRFRGTIAWNSLTNKETTATTLKEFKRCLVQFDTDKMNFEPILATTKNRDIGYEYF